MAKEARRYRIIGGIKVKALPSVKEIERTYRLDRETWILWTKPIPGKEKWIQKLNEGFASQPAGQLTQAGYIVVHFNSHYKKLAAHRLIWKLAHGRDPVGVIDHINGIRDDNRIENLRDVTPAENAMNAIRDRWNAEIRARKVGQAAVKANAKAQKQRLREERERATYARLKVKYETVSAASASS